MRPGKKKIAVIKCIENGLKSDNQHQADHIQFGKMIFFV